MTVTNHAFTGAVIAAAIQQPTLALPLALVSHFVLDVLPHFDNDKDVHAYHQTTFFKIFLSLDILIATSIFGLVALFFNRPGKLTILLAMIVAISPDFVWGYRFVIKERWGKLKPGPMHWFNRFHTGIQRFIHPWGIIVEVIWFTILCQLWVFLT